MPAHPAPLSDADPADIAALATALVNSAVVAALVARGAMAPARQVPTSAAYLPVAQEAAQSSTADTHGTYWRLPVLDLGDTCLDEEGTTDPRAWPTRPAARP